MLITSIELQNFRNYKLQKINLNSNINVFFGDNAQGKTNILESVFISAFGKSYRAKKDNELIKIGEDFSNIIVNYKNNRRAGNVKIQISNKKSIILNGIKIKKLSELLGNINIVLFTPDDINILKEGPSKRRRFLDMMIGQIRPNYVYAINEYMKVLEQRNNYLKQINNYKTINEDLMQIWDEKLTEYGIQIAKYRKEFISKIAEKIKEIHKEITENKEDISIEYITDCENKDDFLSQLKNMRKLDIIKGYTTKGVQKDDFVIYINGQPVNIYGSQGQYRTSILSLKLCELEIIKEEIGETPILLLDDFMSELDEKRICNFAKHIKNTQVIITCTKEIYEEEVNKTVFYIKEGKVEYKK